MGNFILRISKAQAVLETSIIFVMAILFLLGIIRIWVWAEGQIIGRQIVYNNSRVLAGTVGRENVDEKPLYWPIYHPKPLKESWAIPSSPFKK